MPNSRSRLIAATAGLAASLAGCAGPSPYAPAAVIALQQPSLDLAREVNRKLEDHLALNGDFHPNDLIRLSFPYFPLLQSDQRVQLSGLISPPLLAPMQTRGLSVTQVQDRLTAPYRDGMSLFEGLARAGGAGRDADLSRVVLLAPDGDHMAARLVNLKAVLTGDAATLGYLSPFSILIVPPTALARDADMSRQVRAIIGFNGVTVGSAVTLVQP